MNEEIRIWCHLCFGKSFVLAALEGAVLVIALKVGGLF